MRPNPMVPTVFFGSGWGGWNVAEGTVGSHSVVYSGGVGHDSSFDEALIAHYGCIVHAFDPTPIGRRHAESVAATNDRFVFHPWGLWNEDRTVNFFVPATPGADSYSIVNLAETSSSTPGVVRKLRTIMNELGHDHIDLLKIDIEGAEYAVLGDVLTENIRVRQICVEFDQPTTLGAIYRVTRGLQRAGFCLVARSEWDHTFVLRDATEE